MGPGPTSFSIAPDPVGFIVDSGPPIWLLLFEVMFSAALAAIWLRAISWARRRDQADRDAEEVRQLEEMFDAPR
jgi:hypothetical protein